VGRGEGWSARARASPAGASAARQQGGALLRRGERAARAAPVPAAPTAAHHEGGSDAHGAHHPCCWLLGEPARGVCGVGASRGERAARRAALAAPPAVCPPICARPDARAAPAGPGCRGAARERLRSKSIPRPQSGARRAPRAPAHRKALTWALPLTLRAPDWTAPRARVGPPAARAGRLGAEGGWGAGVGRRGGRHELAKNWRAAGQRGGLVGGRARARARRARGGPAGKSYAAARGAARGGRPPRRAWVRAGLGASWLSFFFYLATPAAAAGWGVGWGHRDTGAAAARAAHRGALPATPHTLGARPARRAPPPRPVSACSA
jgi:hypothetical protein